MKKWLQIILPMLAVLIVGGLMISAFLISNTTARNDEREEIAYKQQEISNEQQEVSDQYDELISISTSATHLHEEYFEENDGLLRNNPRNSEFVNRAARHIGQLNALEVDSSLEQLKTSISERVRADMQLWSKLAVKKDGLSEADAIAYYTAYAEAVATETELRKRY